MGKRFLHNRAAVVTVAFVLLIALIGILAPLLAPHDPYVTDILNKFAPYSLEYPLGTDHLGRCVLSRLIYGIRPTLGLALLTMLGTIALGALLGVMAGYFRGVVEEVIMRVVDVMLSFPSQIMVFAVVGLLGINVQNVIIANVFIKWAWYARMIRTGVMQYRDRNFVQFSRCVGMPERFILFRHLLPSITSDLAVLASLDVGWAIINISTLSFLGLGVQAPTPEWGAMLNEAKDVLTSTQVQVMDLLRDLKEKLGLTYVFITHDLTSITYLCDDVLFLYQGRVTEYLPVSRISETKDEYARRLLESIVVFDTETSEVDV